MTFFWIGKGFLIKSVGTYFEAGISTVYYSISLPSILIWVMITNMELGSKKALLPISISIFHVESFKL